MAGCSVRRRRGLVAGFVVEELVEEPGGAAIVPFARGGPPSSLGVVSGAVPGHGCSALWALCARRGCGSTACALPPIAVVETALYIHKGSAESKDGEEKLEAALRRIEEHLGTLPATAPQGEGQQWKLPETPLEAEDRAGS